MTQCIQIKKVTEKRLKTELPAIRESLEKREIESALWVNSKYQLADYPTKEWVSREKLYEGLIGKIKLYYYLYLKKKR